MFLRHKPKQRSIDLLRKLFLDELRECLIQNQPTTNTEDFKVKRSDTTTAAFKTKKN